MFRLNGGVVSWKSSKQDTVADSTIEAEYIVASEAAKEAVWINKFIAELGVVPSITDALELYCDNNGAIAQAKEPQFHQRSKHILRRFHLIREIVDRGDVKKRKVYTNDNVILTNDKEVVIDIEMSKLIYEYIVREQYIGYDNVTDPLRKPLTQQKHNRYTKSLDIGYVSDWS